MSTARRKPDVDAALPADKDTERWLLGAALTGGLDFGRIVDNLSVDDFSLDNLRIIFRRMKDLHRQNKPIDRVLLFQELARHSEDQKVGGLAYLLDLDKDMPAVIHPDHWVDVLRSKTLRRRMYIASHKVGKRALLPTETDEDLVRDWIDQASEFKAETAKDGIQVEQLDAIKIYDANYPEPTPIIDSILFHGLTMIGGRPKIGKSYLAIELAIAIASGQKFGGFLQVHQPGKVLYVSLEDRPRQTRSRLRKMTSREDFLHNITFIHDLPGSFTTRLDALDQVLSEHPMTVVIIDSLLNLAQQTSRPKGIDAMQADYNLIAPLREMAEKRGLAMVLVVHTRKASAEYIFDEIQGTSGITAVPDALWVLQKKSDTAAVLHVTGREFPNMVYGLTRMEALWRIEGAGEEYTLSEERQAIVELLRDNGPMKPMEIARILDKKTCTIYKLIRKLCAVNILFKKEHGTYTVFDTVSDHQRTTQ